MSAQNASVWLGSARPWVFKLILATAAILAGTSVLMIVSQFTADPYSVPALLHPSESVVVQVFLYSLLAVMVLIGIYTSDIQGTIEGDPTGPMDIVSLVIGRITMILISYVVAIMFYEVVVRYVFEKPTLWANELSRWMAFGVFLLAGLYAMQQRSHIRIYVIYDMMPRWMQKASDILSVVLIWLFAAAAIWGGWNEARDKFNRWETLGTAFDPPIPATMKFSLLAIFVLVAMQALSNLIADWNKVPEHHSPSDEIDEAEIEELRQVLGADAPEDSVAPNNNEPRA